MTTQELLKQAKAAALGLACLTAQQKNSLLLRMQEELLLGREEILRANREDLQDAQSVYSPVMLDRLTLTQKRIEDMAEGILQVSSLPDPVGKVLEEQTLPNGLQLQKIRVPFGVIAVIYESRPNVTSDVAALCIQSGNVCVLRGGKEAYRTSHAIVNTFHRALEKEGLPVSFINILEDTSRQGATDLMTATGFVDLLIPRGGAGLIRSCVEQEKVPCIQTGTGICHIYVDNAADIQKALSILENAKTSRPSVCNACEVCLVNEHIAKAFLPKLKDLLVTKRIEQGLVPVELRTDEVAQEIIGGTPAKDTDFDTEFLDYILAVHVVHDVQEAIQHIARHSTHHSEAIITENKDHAELFTRMVDSAVVYVNASTRFTDGGEFGLGCEIGISTQKLHARGPMGLEELTTYKYIVLGNGQIR